MTDRQALAWIGVFDGEPDPEFIWHDEAKARRWINTRPGVELAPLAIAPTLTDEERAALHWFAHYGLPEARAATLRGLLERLA